MLNVRNIQHKPLHRHHTPHRSITTVDHYCCYVSLKVCAHVAASTLTLPSHSPHNSQLNKPRSTSIFTIPIHLGHIAALPWLPILANVAAMQLWRKADKILLSRSAQFIMRSLSIHPYTSVLPTSSLDWHRNIRLNWVIHGRWQQWSISHPWLTSHTGNLASIFLATCDVRWITFTPARPGSLCCRSTQVRQVWMWDDVDNVTHTNAHWLCFVTEVCRDLI